MTFYRTFNCIYSTSKGANSELISVQLFQFHCLTFMLYATEAIPMSKTFVRMLENCVKQESVRPRWPYDMRPSVRAEKYIRDASG